MSRLRALLSGSKVKARHIKRTLIMSPDDDVSQPTPHLIDIVLQAARTAMDTDLPEVSARISTPPYWPDYWPGEHYRLLAAFVRILKPAKIIEIGTHTGLSALSLKQYLPDTASIHTFDVIPWDEIPDTSLKADDFKDGKLTQIIADMGNPETMAEHADKLKDASLFFVDGPKDKIFEPAFLKNLEQIKFTSPPYLIFDDTKDWNMLKVWRDIKAPKLDITSFGHWTGTGIVHWTP